MSEMTEEEFKRRSELASKYRDIEAVCEKKLTKLIRTYEKQGYNRYKFKLFPGATPLGYAFLKKDPDFDLENFNLEESTDYYYIDINGTLSEPFKETSLLINETKNIGSITPFDWTKDELYIIQACDHVINAKSRTIPITAKESNIIIGHKRIKRN
jgi:hypothetical protein